MAKQHKGWVGVDLDGTLAEYQGWVAPDHIGEPIPEMVKHVKRMLDEGVDVRIFTARITVKKQRVAVIRAVQAWCKKHIGRTLPVTAAKDIGMITCIDDRCKQVIPNTGVLVEAVARAHQDRAMKLTDAIVAWYTTHYVNTGSVPGVEDVEADAAERELQRIAKQALTGRAANDEAE